MGGKRAETSEIGFGLRSRSNVAGFDDLERWAAEARARDAAEARARERWLRTQAEEGARLAQVLAGLAEQRAAVVVATTAGREVRGRLSRVGRDFLTVETTTGRLDLIALTALAWVRPTGSPDQRRRQGPQTGPDAGDYEDGRDEPAAGDAGVPLAEVLAQAAADRPRVALYAGVATLTGELRAVGVDIVIVEVPGQPPGHAYARLASIYEISFLDSG